MFFITLSNVYCLPLNARSVVKTLYLSPKYLDPILSKCIPMLKLKCLVAEENLSKKKCTNNFVQYCPLNLKKKIISLQGTSFYILYHLKTPFWCRLQTAKAFVILKKE